MSDEPNMSNPDVTADDPIRQIVRAAREAFPECCAFALHCEFGMGGSLMHITISAGERHVDSLTEIGLLNKLRDITTAASKERTDGK